MPLEICQGNANIKACPYYLGQSLVDKTMDCTYHPDNPRKNVDPHTKKVPEHFRESAYLTPDQRADVGRIFSVQVPQAVSPGPEWDNARGNVITSI